MKFILLIFILLVTGSEKLVKVEVTDKITIKLPEDFTPMSESDREQRVDSYRKPIAVYTDPSRTVEFAVNFSYSLWNSYDLELLKSFYKASIMEMFSEVDFLNEEIKTIGKRDFVVFEFISTSKAEGSQNLRPIRKYTRLLYTLEHGQTILFNFTCPLNLQVKWQDISGEIMQTIRIK